MPICGFLLGYQIFLVKEVTVYNCSSVLAPDQQVVCVCVVILSSGGKPGRERAVIKDGVPGQEEASFCHRMEQTPKQVRRTGQREKEMGHRRREREHVYNQCFFS